MKKRLTICLAVLCCVMMAAGACAETMTLSGTVSPAKSVQVYAPIGGTVGEVNVEAGEAVKADDILYSMKTTKVYAAKDGTVTGIFAEPGDTADTASSRYGAVMYMEETSVFSVSASTETAYNSTEARFIHVGETVYLVCRNNSERTGKGRITAVSGTSYTVEVTEGSFIASDAVDVYRDENHSGSKKIGKGTVSRTAPTAISASGSIVRIAVTDGQEVKRGDLLIETLDGTFDGYYMSGTEIAAGQDGVVGSVSVNKGSSVQKDSVAAVIYPTDVMRVEGYVPEDYRNRIKEGDAVVIELETDESKTYQGTVVLVSSVAEDKGDEVQYKVVAEFKPDEAVRFGMSAVIVAGQEEEEEEEPEEEKEGEPAKEAEEAKEESGKRERPEGMPGGERPEMPADGTRPEMPEGFSWADFGGSSGDRAPAAEEVSGSDEAQNP